MIFIKCFVRLFKLKDEIRYVELYKHMIFSIKKIILDEITANVV
jgi:hypothetical protein